MAWLQQLCLQSGRSRVVRSLKSTPSRTSASNARAWLSVLQTNRRNTSATAVEGVENVDQVLEAGALVAMGFRGSPAVSRAMQAMWRSVRRIGNSACRSARWRKLSYPNPTSRCISTGKGGNADQIVAILGNAAPASVKGAATLMVSGIPVRRRTPNPLPASRLIVGRRPGHRNRFCFCPCSASVFWVVPLQPFYLR